MFRLAICSLLLAIVMALFGFGVLAGDFAGLALVLFGLSLFSSGVFFGLGALNARDANRCYN